MDRLLTRPKSLTDLAHDRIRQLIVGGELPMGSELSEATLAAQLGISKTPVREALLRLRVDGLIDIQPQRGTFVFSLTPEQVEEICVFREVVEVTAVRLAMERRHAELAKCLQANVREMARARKARDWKTIRQLIRDTLESYRAATNTTHCAEA
jgi:DNA-binding GntR family transcriptional regulator